MEPHQAGVVANRQNIPLLYHIFSDFLLNKGPFFLDFHCVEFVGFFVLDEVHTAKTAAAQLIVINKIPRALQIRIFFRKSNFPHDIP